MSSQNDLNMNGDQQSTAIKKASSVLSLDEIKKVGNENGESEIKPLKPLLRSYSSSSLLMREPQYELIGSRVVRGPDWKWGKQDGTL